MITLRQGQEEAIRKLRNGSILFGTVGSGKSLTSLVYYVRRCGGVEFKSDPFTRPMNLYIITPASKRDKHEWDKELTWCLIGMQPNVKVTVDSWNNVHKYAKVKGAFFIFDEQRIVGSGTWVKSFLKIAEKNEFILLTATPGDVWTDYIPIFIANKFYESRRSFILEHAVYQPYLNYPKIVRYNNEKKLQYYRDKLLVCIPEYSEQKLKHYYNSVVEYNTDLFNKVVRERWNPWKDKPIKNAAEVCYLMRKASNIHDNRIHALLHAYNAHRKIIVFYNFDYELDYLKDSLSNLTVREYNGHKHEEIPDTDEWVYLVQYTAGAEAWNCIITNAIVFYSLNYSYKRMIQAAGRIDRMDSPYTELYYYTIMSNSLIDKSILAALTKKKNFNELSFRKQHGI